MSPELILPIWCKYSKHKQYSFFQSSILLSSTCTREHRGEIQLSVSGKVGSVEEGPVVGPQSIYHGVDLLLPWSSLGSHA